MNEPRTEAGRSLMRFNDTQVGCGDLLADVLAIETEAGALDVERLAQSMEQGFQGRWFEQNIVPGDIPYIAAAVADAYLALGAIPSDDEG